MKLLLFSTFFLTSFNIFSQPKKIIRNDTLDFQLDTIKDFRIKIDGGCSFYALDSVSLSNGKNIFVISAKKMGFVSLQNEHEYIYLKEWRRELLNTGNRKQFFSGDGFTATLTVNKIGVLKHSCAKNYYTGTFEIKNKKFTHIYKVSGKVDE